MYFLNANNTFYYQYLVLYYGVFQNIKIYNYLLIYDILYN